MFYVFSGTKRRFLVAHTQDTWCGMLMLIRPMCIICIDHLFRAGLSSIERRSIYIRLEPSGRAAKV